MKISHILSRLVAGGCYCFILASCTANDDYMLSQPPNYDRLIGKSFTESIFKGRQVYKKVRETESVEELEYRRGDGCILVFGVRKTDDIIQYWRVDSGPGTCYTRRRPINV